jgi:tetratricopeptide (TPR) repeat protein
MSTEETDAPPHAVAAAKTAVEAGRFDEAIALLEGHLRDHPGNVQGWHRLAGALIGAHRLIEAVGAADRAIDLDPEDEQGHLAAAHRMRAVALLESGRPAEAEQSAARSAELNPTVADTHAALATALLLQNKPGADAAIRVALSLDAECRAARHLEHVVAVVRRTGWLMCAGAVAGSVATLLGALVIFMDGATSVPRVVLAAIVLLVAAILSGLVAGVLSARAGLPGRRPPALLPPARYHFTVLPAAGAVVTAVALTVAGVTGRPVIAVTAAAAVLQLFPAALWRIRASRRA